MAQSLVGPAKGPAQAVGTVELARSIEAIAGMLRASLSRIKTTLVGDLESGAEAAAPSNGLNDTLGEALRNLRGCEAEIELIKQALGDLPGSTSKHTR